MEKRKFMGIGLSALFILGTACGLIGMVPQKTAHAEEQVTSLTTENADLFLPASYEQYLPLKNPTYMAMSEHYIAVADGSLLYIYDKTEGAYTTYEYVPVGTGSTVSTISKIQISDNERIFFSVGVQIFEYNFNNGEEELVHDIAGNTFLVDGDYLYTSILDDGHRSVLSRYPLASLDYRQRQEIASVDNISTPTKLAVEGGILYCVRDNRYIVAYDTATCTKIEGPNAWIDNQQEVIGNLQRVCAYNGSLYYSVDGTTSTYRNGLYRTDFKGSAERLIEGEGFSAITTYDGELYAIQNASVHKLNVTDEGVSFAGYEIASASSSENRLSGAVDTVRAGNLLLTADAGNNRVSVYNFTTNSYSVIPCNEAPSYVATDGKTIAVATQHEIFTCTYEKQTLTSLKKLEGNISVQGLACSFGDVYYVTNNNGYGVNDGNLFYDTTYGTPQGLACDLYGNLYVSFTSGNVYSFTEETFLQSSQGRRLGFTLPVGSSSLRSDFEGNLYCVSENQIYKNGEAFAEIDGNDFVYHKDGETSTLVSFALGFENSEVYFNFGNYTVKSKADALSIPTLDKILAGDAKTDTFTVHGFESLFVDIPEKTVAIRFNLTKLREDDSPYFPYESYCRLPEDRRSLLVSETEDFYVVVIPDCLGGEECSCPPGYDCKAELCHCVEHSYIIHKNENFLVDDEEYYEEASESAYLSSGVHSYFAPSLETALQDNSLLRGTPVTVLGYVSAPDRDYALVRFDGGTGAREAKTGYVPKSFLTEISPLPTEVVEYIPVYLKASEEGVVFLLQDGDEEITVTERTAAKAIKNEDGTYTVLIEQDGKTYVAKSVEESQIDWQTSDALRIAFIIILSTLALVIIAAYIFLLPRKTRTDKPKKKEKAEKKPEQKE